MGMTREQMAALVADAIAEHFEEMMSRTLSRVQQQFETFQQRTRADVFEKMHEMELRARAPNFQLTSLGELYCNGEKIGDVRPVFQRVVVEALKSAGHIKDDRGDDDDN